MKEEKKAWALIEQGYDGSYNGDAYGSVMYQNENLSVRVSDEFMQAAHRGQGMVDARRHHRQAAGKEGRQRRCCTRSPKAPGSAATRACNTTAPSRNGTPARAPSRSTPPIPAREYVFLNNTACNLASLNLMKFKREDGTFDVERFKAAVRIFITAQEILVDNASYPTKEIAENSHIFRTLGLGYANLGSLIMSYGLPYDSDEGRALAGAITAIMTGHAYEQSAEIAAVMGAFKGYRDARCAHVAKPLAEDNVESMLGVIKQHRDAVEDIQPSQEFNYLKDEARKTWDGALERGRAARLPQRAGHRAGAHRHHRLPDGLRHHRHRARHRAGEIQAAGRRRHAEDRQPHACPKRCAGWATARRKSSASSPTSRNSTRLKTSRRAARPSPAA